MNTGERQCTACGAMHPSTTEFFFIKRIGKRGKPQLSSRCRACEQLMKVARDYRNRPKTRARWRDNWNSKSKTEQQAHNRQKYLKRKRRMFEELKQDVSSIMLLRKPAGNQRNVQAGSSSS